MAAGTQEVDYLVIGAGLAGLAFTDTLIDHRDVTVLMVDRRHGPGGHWNDAYPFVRLHQPSAFYGVSSMSLGQDRIDERGPNAGFLERATAAEVCHYFQAVMQDRLIPSGRMEFLPMTDCVEAGDGQARLTSRLTGAEREVTVRRKVIDARYLESAIPATRPPTYEVDEGVRCIPVNGLVDAEEAPGGYVVIGAGKTSMDACGWLLDHGVDSDRITWVKPRESWVLERGTYQAREKVADFFIPFAASVEASAVATSIPDLFQRLEACGDLTRIDPSIEPTMYRAAILSELERERLRSIEHVVRAGHVRRLQPDRMVLDDAEVATPAAPLYVDCTADGLVSSVSKPIFEPDRVTIQPIREGSPSFNAAVIGYIEATRDDVAEQNALAPTTPYMNKSTDWIRTRHTTMLANQAWDQAPDVAAWVEGTRLNLAAGAINHASDPGMGEAFTAYLTHAGAAIENLARFRAELGEVA